MPVDRSALSELVVRVQRARAMDEAFRTVALGLEAQGLKLTVLQREEGKFRVCFVSRAGSPTREVREMTGRSVQSHLVSLPPDSPLMRVFTERQPLFVGNLAEVGVQFFRGQTGIDPVRLAASFQNQGYGRGVVAPIWSAEKPWGTLVLSSDGLQPEDTEPLAAFAAHVSSAVEMAGVIESLERRNRELAAIESVADAGRVTDLALLCEQLRALAERSLESDGAVLLLMDEPTRELVVAAPLGSDPSGKPLPPLRVPMDHTVTGETAKTLLPRRLHVQEVNGSSWPATDWRQAKELGMVEVALVPLHVDGRVLGSVNLFRRTERPYTEEELHFAEILADQMAIQLQKARLYADVEQRVREISHVNERLSKAQAELVRHERLAALGELSAVMAHEVRNPLGVIFNSLTRLRRLTASEAPEVQTLLRIMSEEAERLNRIVADLLDFARPFEVLFGPVNVELLVSSALDSARQLLSDGRVTFERAALPASLEVRGDPNLLRQALVNLLVNAAQATPGAGQVHVRAFSLPDGARVCIEVEDFGTGISAQHRSRLFEPFFTTKASGTGLGLAVIKRIVDAHGGEVEVNTEPGRGSRFRVILSSAN